MTSVLIVDDHPVVLQGCRRILEDAGITAVLEASDPATGYELFRNHRPDVGVIDLSMRDDGLGASTPTIDAFPSLSSACTAIPQ